MTNIVYLINKYPLSGIYLAWVLFISLPLLASCDREGDYVETSYIRIYQVVSISLEGESELSMRCSDNLDFDAESRAFYQAADTSLTFKLRRPNHAHPERGTIGAIDWRIASIEATTMEDFDENHPAGSSMNDLLCFEYEYKNKRHSIPLTEIKYGTIMLIDYYPYDPDWKQPWFRLSIDRVRMPHMEVTIKDAFGRTLTAQSEHSD